MTVEIEMNQPTVTTDTKGASDLLSSDGPVLASVLAAAAVGWFLVRNSWSTSWGEDGYLRLAIDGNACGVANEATVAVVEEGE